MLYQDNLMLCIFNAGAVSGFSLSGGSDGVLGLGGTGTLSMPTVPLNSQSTSFTGGGAVGFGAGVGGIGTFAWFQKVYGFN